MYVFLVKKILASGDWSKSWLKFLTESWLAEQGDSCKLSVMVKSYRYIQILTSNVLVYLCGNLGLAPRVSAAGQSEDEGEGR